MKYESIEAWIDRQPWPDDVKALARSTNKSRQDLGLNPMTGSAWAAFAERQGVEIALVTR
jgi:hypothetical protein